MGDRGTSGGGSDDSGRIQYPQLTTTNYTTWSIRVQATMEDQGVWEIMEPSATTVAAEKTKDRRVKAHLLQCLSDDLLLQVAMNRTGKKVWDSLKA